jgi:hypothetical protein
MKIGVTILFSVFILTGFSQTNSDSLRLSMTDSIIVFWLPDTLVLDLNSFLPEIPHYTSYEPKPMYLFFIPHCSKLIKQNGLFYFDQDTIPYSGSCMVAHNGEMREGILLGSSPSAATINFDLKSQAEIKIISHYKDGKRHGVREYYDINGKLFKIETYENGQLTSTDYLD